TDLAVVGDRRRSAGVSSISCRLEMMAGWTTENASVHDVHAVPRPVTARVARGSASTSYRTFQVDPDSLWRTLCVSRGGSVLDSTNESVSLPSHFRFLRLRPDASSRNS